jgi:hypothetical protein
VLAQSKYLHLKLKKRIPFTIINLNILLQCEMSSFRLATYCMYLWGGAGGIHMNIKPWQNEMDYVIHSRLFFDMVN